jgi:hypothetical protein
VVGLRRLAVKVRRGTTHLVQTLRVPLLAIVLGACGSSSAGSTDAGTCQSIYQCISCEVLQCECDENGNQQCTYDGFCGMCSIGEQQDAASQTDAEAGTQGDGEADAPSDAEAAAPLSDGSSKEASADALAE